MATAPVCAPPTASDPKDFAIWRSIKEGIGASYDPAVVKAFSTSSLTDSELKIALNAVGKLEIRTMAKQAGFSEENHQCMLDNVGTAIARKLGIPSDIYGARLSVEDPSLYKKMLSLDPSSKFPNAIRTDSSDYKIEGEHVVLIVGKKGDSSARREVADVIVGVNDLFNKSAEQRTVYLSGLSIPNPKRLGQVLKQLADLPDHGFTLLDRSDKDNMFVTAIPNSEKITGFVYGNEKFAHAVIASDNNSQGKTFALPYQSYRGQGPTTVETNLETGLVAEFFPLSASSGPLCSAPKVSISLRPDRGTIRFVKDVMVDTFRKTVEQVPGTKPTGAGIDAVASSEGDVVKWKNPTLKIVPDCSVELVPVVEKLPDRGILK